MGANKKTARIAGAIYLIVVLTGMFSLAYVPSKLIAWNNPAQTYHNIKTSDLLFRLSILSNFICYTAFLALPLVLYKLLNEVNNNHAKLMVILVMVSVSISFINIQNKLAVLSLIGEAEYLKVFSLSQLQSQVMFYIDNYYNGMIINQIFWGLWLFPFGYLVYRSGFLPKILGIFLILGCFGYLLNVIGETAIPNYDKSVISNYITLPASIGEIGTCLWLLIIGIKEKPDSNKS
ncbi:DUF4386 domain-containing protein [Pedobacter jeongneungensis]|uniref:DUF4386 domain-containing protein n=1 Tax=Pedobacter jeongneungensis TaxID=947309 RepID=UPI00046A6165|nr:DUF4386 domain-containing protein [Pedobacter jeongneungensis]